MLKLIAILYLYDKEGKRREKGMEIYMSCY
jgi:hypothetical protein